MLADMVAPGNRLVDVGCDHGYLSIYLVREGVCPGALAMDIRKGPLACAEEHIMESGLGDYIEVRLSDGLAAYAEGEAETMVCAGMGGRLMEKILTDSMEKARRLQELILQPQSELQEFRAFLRKAGFTVVKENAVCEEGKYYFAMKAVPDSAVDCAIMKTAGRTAAKRQMIEKKTSEKESMGQLYDRFGELLLKERHPVLLEFLLQRQTYVEQLRKSLAVQDSKKAEGRCAELDGETAVIKEALSFYA